MSVRIVTDSTSDLPRDVVEELGITVVPLNVHFDMDTYRDGVDIDAEEFYKRLITSSTLPKTSAPAPGVFIDSYRKLAGEVEAIVSIHISSKLSGTYESAQAAQRDLAGECRIEVINSESVSMGLGLLAITAAKAAKAGATAEEIVKLVRESIPRVHLVGALDTLEFLAKGGRVGKASAWIGSLLSIKPLISVRDGEVVPLDRVRTRSKSLERFHQLLKEHLPAKELGVMYSTDVEEAEKLAEHLKELFPQQPVYLARFGPVLGTYMGPGCLAAAAIT
jgi:DegV family protein with EDD domain